MLTRCRSGSADSALAAGGKTHSATAPPKRAPAVQTALRYVEAVAHGDRVTAGQLDFACQYRFITGSPTKVKQFAPAGDPSYICWHTLTEAHAPMLKRTDTVMDVIWPSTGPLVFFGDDTPRAAASAFVMDVLGISPLEAACRRRSSTAAPFQPVRSVSRPKANLGRADDVGSNIRAVSRSPDLTGHLRSGQRQMDQPHQTSTQVVEIRVRPSGSSSRG